MYLALSTLHALADSIIPPTLIISTIIMPPLWDAETETQRLETAFASTTASNQQLRMRLWSLQPLLGYHMPHSSPEDIYLKELIYLSLLLGIPSRSSQKGKSR